MADDERLLRVGDIIEFDRSHPLAPSEWHPQTVTQIRVCEEFDDKEGVAISEISWRTVREFEVLVVILGTEYWARNDQIRPCSA